MAELTEKQRRRLKKSDFAIPEKRPGPGSYPIPDLKHARVALAMVSRFGTRAEKNKVKSAIWRKFKTARKWPSLVKWKRARK